jgi:hypothetical protein
MGSARVRPRGRREVLGDFAVGEVATGALTGAGQPRRDVEVIEHRTGTLVFFAGAPISRNAERTGDPTAPTLHAIYAALAQSSPYARYTYAGVAVLSGGRWTATLPCLAGEPCTGRDANGTPVNVVRAPDGAHFCPGAPAAVRGVTAACSVWPSGSWRLGNALAAPVIAELCRRATRRTPWPRVRDTMSAPTIPYIRPCDKPRLPLFVPLSEAAPSHAGVALTMVLDEVAVLRDQALS